MTGGPDGQDVVAARLARVAAGIPTTPGHGPARAVTAAPCAPEPGAVRSVGWTPDPPSGRRPGGAFPRPVEARERGAATEVGSRTATDAATDAVTDPAIDARGLDDATAARRALSAAMASYTAAHGHPLAVDEVRPPGRFRLAVRARVAAAAVAALLVVVGVVAVRAWRQTPSMTVPAPVASVAEDAGGAAAMPAGASNPTTDATGTAPTVVVHVVGEVLSPGVVALGAGARVADAVAAAGGASASADLSAINLARVLTDGEQVVVPAPGQPPAAATGTSGTAADAGGSGLVDLNQADAAAFDTLPGIGPVLAERIVAWREEHGRFTAVEELTEVSGIGPALLAGVRDLVQVG